MRSSFNGNFFAFNKKPRKKSYDDDDAKGNNIKKKNKVLFDNPKKFNVKRLRSSVVDNIPTLKYKSEVTRSKTNPIKKFFKNNSKTNSFDDKLCKNSNNNNKFSKIDSSTMEKIKKKRRSLSIKQKEVIDKWKNKIQL